MSTRPSLRKLPTPALWRWQREALRVQLEDPSHPARHFSGRPFLHVLGRLVEVRPPEVPEVHMSGRRAVDVPALPFHMVGHLAAEVLMVFVEGPVAQEEPHRVVGIGPADLAGLGEEHEVHLGLAVDVEAQEDLEPEVHCVLIIAPLDDVPLVGEAPMEELVVTPLEVPPCWSIEVLHPPEGREALMDGRLVPLLRCRWRSRSSEVLRRRGILQSLPPCLRERRWRRRRTLVVEEVLELGHGRRTLRNTDEDH